MDDMEEYTVNDDLRACGLPADDDNDLTVDAEALFGSNVARSMSMALMMPALVLEVMASARRRLRRRPRRLLLLLPTTSC